MPTGGHLCFVVVYELPGRRIFGFAAWHCLAQPPTCACHHSPAPHTYGGSQSCTSTSVTESHNQQEMLQEASYKENPFAIRSSCLIKCCL